MNEAEVRKFLARLNVTLAPATHSGWMNGNCPFAPWTHKNGTDKSPSFGVKVNETGTVSYFCYSCKEHGSLHDLVYKLGKLRGVDYSELLALLDKNRDAALELMEFEQAVQQPQALEPLDEDAWSGMFEDPFADPVPAAYLERRNVDPDTAKRLGLGYDPESFRITFPVRGAQGELYGFSGRSVLPEARMKVMDYAGLPKRSLILGRERWLPRRPVLIVEGLFAFAHMHAIGAEARFNIGALLGSVMTPEKRDILCDFGHAVIAMLDPDEAGLAGTFGRIDKTTGRQLFGESLVGQLYNQVPVYVPDLEGVVDDVDNMTLDTLHALVDTTEEFIPSRDQLRALTAGNR